MKVIGVQILYRAVVGDDEVVDVLQIDSQIRLLGDLYASALQGQG